MNVAVGLANIALGIIYSCYGVMTLIELKRGWSTLGLSHFGLAWVAMAFTCGPHHLEHGLHALFSGNNAGNPRNWCPGSRVAPRSFPVTLVGGQNTVSLAINPGRVPEGSYYATSISFTSP